MKKPSEHHTFIKLASTWANDQSVANRRKVGALIVKNGATLSHGHNGTISGFDNRCEDKNGDTYNNHVLHAESNALVKMMRSTQSTEGATMYCTDMPCINCAKLIASTYIKTLYYARDYHNRDGLDVLLCTDINVYQINMDSGESKLLNRREHHSLVLPENRGKEIDFTMGTAEFFRSGLRRKYPNEPSDINFNRNVTFQVQTNYSDKWEDVTHVIYSQGEDNEKSYKLIRNISTTIRGEIDFFVNLDHIKKIRVINKPRKNEYFNN